MMKNTVLYQIVDIQISIISAIETISLRKITVPSSNKIKIYTFWKVCYCTYNKFLFKNIDETLFLIWARNTALQTIARRRAKRRTNRRNGTRYALLVIRTDDGSRNTLTLIGYTQTYTRTSCASIALRRNFLDFRALCWETSITTQ